MNKVCCVVPIFGRYKKNRPFYCENSIRSFKKWHPNIEIIIMDDKYIQECENFNEMFKKFSIIRFSFIKKLFQNGYNKVIVIGADTITCGVFDEFINDNDTPLLCTLDYKMLWNIDFDMKPFIMPNHGVFEWPHINGEVLCVNKESIIDRLITICKERNCIDQIAMNFIYTYESGIKIVDFPYEFSLVTYNNRAKGGIGADCINKDGKMHFGFDGPKIGEFSPIKVWKPINDKLYNQDGKHVKLFHFCTHGDGNAKEWFNDETINFFKTYCDCDWDIPYHNDHYDLDT